MKLHGYFRSSAAYRVRIALGLKGLSYDNIFHHLRHGAQSAPDYLALNPQGLVPALETEGEVLTQSLAICEYLDEIAPTPPLLPADPLRRAKVRGFAQAIACDIHPIQNLKVLRKLAELGLDQGQVNGWAGWIIADGFAACEALIAGESGPFCFGAKPTLADICLVPQIANARRFGVDLSRYSRLTEANTACLSLPAFQNAAPERQPDAE